MKFLSLTLSMLAIAMFGALHAQVNNHRYNVLFLGNSYTYVNNLPVVASNAALSAGDTLTYDSNTIGGYTLQQHSADATSLSKIAAGNWDYVVLQEQSQLPSFPQDQVDADVLPYAHKLDSLVHAYNTCGRSMFYMTWGRKNGDASNCPSWPPVCTYAGMDSMLYMRYMGMADSSHALVSPVGAVWKYIRANYPSIELYQTDESHPSEAGTYAAACCFYTAIFKRSPLLISYNFTLPAADAANIRTAVKNVVFDSLAKWHIKEYSPKANGSYAAGAGNSATFTNTSTNATGYVWSFDDGSTSTLSNPTHAFSTGGTHTVTLAAIKCGKSDSLKMVVTLPVSSVADIRGNTSFQLYPNPATSTVTISKNSPASDWHVAIVNTLGQVVATKTMHMLQSDSLDIAALPAGCYTVIISADDGSVIGRQILLKHQQ